jgi:FOG: Transposase and inactivated derivatives
MRNYTTTFKIMESEISRYELQKSIDFFQGDKHVRTLKTGQLFNSLLFAQTMNCFSIREIEHSLYANANKLYHNGMTSIKRSTFADALEKRDYRIFQMVYEKLLNKACAWAGRAKRHFDNPLKIIDSTSLEVNVNKFNWALYRQTKGGMKLHVCYDPDTALMRQMFFTDGKCPDIKRLNSFAYDKGDILVFDRGYCDYNSLYVIELNQGLFVTRVKKNACYAIDQVFSTSQTDCIRKDMAISFKGHRASKEYPKSLRVVEFFDQERNRSFSFLTNDFKRSANEIADIYKERWQIELFFKWLKQNLKIKTFWGTSRNAVLIQIWVAMILYLLIWIMKAKNAIELSLQRIRQVLKTTLLSKQSGDALFRPPSPVYNPNFEPSLFGDSLC